jgi:hypothetical protein
LSGITGTATKANSFSIMIADFIPFNYYKIQQYLQTVKSSFHEIISLIVYCNMCSTEIDEKEIEKHVSSEQHRSNKKKTLLPKMAEYVNHKSLVQIWSESPTY